MSDLKTYLGDSVYADVGDYGELILTTENGFGPSNTIVLEQQVWAALKHYWDRIEEARRLGMLGIGREGL